MFDVLIREVAARFGLGDKALPLVQMLLAYMTAKETGGLAGFLERMKSAGLGPVLQSWLGGGVNPQPVTNSQLETAFGQSGGLLSLLTSRLGAPRDGITSALGYLLPALVGKLTPGGSIPASLPPEVNALVADGQRLLAAPVAAAAATAPAASGGIMKWLPWIVVALAALFGLNYCSKSKTEAPAPAATAPAPAPAPAASEPPAPAPAPAPAEPASDPASAASAVGAPAGGTPSPAAQATEEPAGSGIVSWLHSEMPALKVYFDSGKSEVAAEFDAKAKDVVDYLKANAGAKAVISGFNDPTGDPVKNAELSKNRAKAVQAALVKAGVAEDHTVLEKPAETSGTAATNAASRRVEVTIRK